MNQSGGEFGMGIIRATFTTNTSIFGNTDTKSDVNSILFLMNLREVRVDSGIDISRKDLAFHQCLTNSIAVVFLPVFLQQFRDKIYELRRFCTGISLTPDLLFIRKEYERGSVQVYWIGFQYSLQRCIGTNTIVVAVTYQKTPVNSSIACFTCRYQFQFGTEEIGFGNTVSLV